MTAANIFIQQDAVHMVTDGAAVRDDGSIDHICPKVSIMPHIKAAVCVRGTPAALAIFCGEMAKADSYDHLKAAITCIVKDAFDRYSPALAAVNPNALTAEIFVAGWSEKSNSPDAYVMATTDFNQKIFPAWKVVPLGGCIVPGGADLERDFSSLPAEFDESRVIELVRRQRESRSPIPGNTSHVPPAGVGGFVQLTTVKRKSIETKILKRWPDYPGDFIQPIAA